MISNFNRSITTNEMEAVIKSLTTKKSPASNGVTDKVYEDFKELMPMSLNLFHKTERKQHYQIHSTEIPFSGN